MIIEEIVALLKGTIHHIPDGYDRNISYASASGILSEVRAYISDSILLITSLLSPQVIRTAYLMDLSAVVFTCGIVPTADIIDSAKESQVAVLTTSLNTYTACGLLYCAGLQGVEGKS